MHLYCCGIDARGFLGEAIARVSPTLLNSHQCPFPLCRLCSMCSKSFSKKSFPTKIWKLTFQREEKREKNQDWSNTHTQTCIYPHRETRTILLACWQWCCLVRMTARNCWSTGSQRNCACPLVRVAETAQGGTMSLKLQVKQGCWRGEVLEGTQILRLHFPLGYSVIC